MLKLLHWRMGHRTLALLLALMLGVTSCTQPAPTVNTDVAHYDARVPLAWFNFYLRLIKETPGFAPPVASRAFAYAGVTLYEALAPGMPGYQSLAGQLNDLPQLPQPVPNRTYHWPTVANTALAEITRKLFVHASAQNLRAIDALEEQLLAEYHSTLPADQLSISVMQGRLVAGAIDAWAQYDGSACDYGTYRPPTGDGLWAPTPPKNLAALLPHWGDHRHFMHFDRECAAAPPPAYSTDKTSPFYKQAREVYDTVTQLTPEQRSVALFWADNVVETATPSGHWFSILNQLLQAKTAPLDVAAVAYAKVGLAVGDAFISCWRTKYQYNLLRPITYIRNVIDPKWTTPDMVTPPFPEYTSGHSVQSAAAAYVLTELFGDHYTFTDHTHTARNLAPRSFPSFLAAAQEAAISRLYGGIHYRAAIENGLAQGKCISEHVHTLRFRIAKE